MKLRTKSFITNLLLPLILFIGVMLFTFKQMSDAKIKDVSETTMAVLHATTSEIKAVLNKSETLLDLGRNNSELKEFIRSGMVQEYSKNTYNENEQYRSSIDLLNEFSSINKDIGLLYIASEKSPAIVSDKWWDMPKGYDARQRGWYKDSKKSKKVSISDPYIDASTKQMTLTMVSPVIDNGSQIGTIAMDFSINEIIVLLNNIQSQHPGLFISLFNGKNSQVLYGGEVSFEDNLFLEDVAKQLGYSDKELQELSTVFKNVLNTGKPKMFESFRSVGVDNIDGTSWIVTASFNRKELLEINLKDTIKTYLFASISFVALLVIAFSMSIMVIFKPIKQLSDKFFDISHGEGDLTVNITHNAKDELGDLAENFNIFLEKIHNIIVAVKKSTNSIEEKQVNLTLSSQETASSSMEITANVDSINEQIENLNSQVQSVSSAMDEINATVDSLFDNTETQTKAVDEASSSIEEMVAQLDSVARIVNEKKGEAEKLTQMINDSGKQISNATSANEEVVELAGRVAEMSEVISNIASQTNLLSMNAAIEAAHAGDSGKGFAVVADEIRKLAEMSQDNSADINQIITDILSKVDIAYKISKSSEDTFNKLRDGTQSTIMALEEINISTQELSQGGALIMNANSQLSDISIHVKESSLEMSHTVEAVADSIKTVADISSNVKVGMGEIAHGTTDISKSVHIVNKLTEEVSESTTQLKEETQKFKTN